VPRLALTRSCGRDDGLRFSPQTAPGSENQAMPLLRIEPQCRPQDGKASERAPLLQCGRLSVPHRRRSAVPVAYGRYRGRAGTSTDALSVFGTPVLDAHRLTPRPKRPRSFRHPSFLVPSSPVTARAPVSPLPVSANSVRSPAVSVRNPRGPDENSGGTDRSSR
jgi:hypothetical protein